VEIAMKEFHIHFDLLSVAIVVLALILVCFGDEEKKA
jgi:hypothetical protein